MKISMKFKLLLFSIIIITCFVSLFILSTAISIKYFDAYTQKYEQDKLDTMVNNLALFYSENGSWQYLENNFELWGMFLDNAASKNEIPEIPIATQRAKENENGIKVDYFLKIQNPMAVEYRISLLDSKKEYIIGRNTPYSEECYFIPIKLNTKTVGWLSIKEERTFHLPLDRAFANNPKALIYSMGSIYLVILTLITFLFSKKILNPITKLVEATKKLSQLNFNIRIPVKSSDELGELSKHFNDMAEKLEEYKKNQKQWLTDISHELRTPISMLICEIDALNDGIQKVDKGSLTSLSNEARHLMKLVNDLNNISLIEAGTFNFKKTLLKPLPILSDEVYIFQKRLESNNLKVSFEFDEEAIDIRILGDHDRLKQLFSNILENAVCHVQKPGKLAIQQTLTSDQMKLVFEDSGPGVPDEALPHLFDRLYRVDLSRSRKTGGSGLGLAICKSIVEMHSGNIRARNTRDGGFVIEIMLPIEIEPYDSMDEPINIEKKKA